MRLWNIAPLAKERDLKSDASLLDRYIDSVIEFFETFYTNNDVEAFFISKVNAISDIDMRESYNIGKVVSFRDIRCIVRLSIHDKISVICRGDGCRSFSFGYDYDAWICTKHSDLVSQDVDGLCISDISRDLIETDWYDN